MAEGDKTRQLNANQEKAIDLLLQGQNDREVAEAIGVSRQTVNGWRRGNAPFVAELNARRRELWQAEHERLRGLLAEAVDVLEVQLKEGEVSDRVRQAAAVHVLKALGLYGVGGVPRGTEDADALAVEWEKAEKAAALDRLLAGM